VSPFLPRCFFLFRRHFVGSGDPGSDVLFDRMWRKAGFRVVIRRMVLVWGLGPAFEAALQVILS
jgi:hypothetical protein